MIININKDKRISGAKKLLDVVSSTYGPGGKTVLIQRQHASPLITKDGATVAKHLMSNDYEENMVINVIKESAEKTMKQAGDGTTTTIILASNMYINALEDKFENTTELRKGMYDTVRSVVDILRSNAKPITNMEQLRDVAFISSNSDVEISDAVSNALGAVGKDGIVTVEETSSENSLLELKEGYTYKIGYTNPAFVTNTEQQTVEYTDAKVLILENPLESVGQISTILSMIKTAGDALVILGTSFSDNCITQLALNKVQGLNVIPVVIPGMGEDKLEFSKDLAAYTSSTVINSMNGIRFNEIRPEYLGRVDKIVVDRNTTAIINKNVDMALVNERKHIIQTGIDNPTTSEFEKMKLQERLGQINGLIVNVKLAARSSSEYKEKKDRFDDALEACRSALAEGIVAGGTTMWLHAYSDIGYNEMPENAHPDYELGVRIVLNSLLEPTAKLLSNKDKSEDYIMKYVAKVEDNQLEDASLVFDFDNLELNGTSYLDSGVIDPVKVLITALVNSASVVSTLLSTNYFLTYEK